MRETTPPNTASSGVLLSTNFLWNDQSHPLKAFVDSGAAGNFMDVEIARHLQVPLTNLDDTPDHHGIGWKAPGFR